MIPNIRQLNPFEIKAEILSLLDKFSEVEDFENYEINFKTLDAQQDKKSISRLLFKELSNVKSEQNANIICFLLERYTDKEELLTQLWAIIKGSMVSTTAKISALNFLRIIDTNLSYDDCSEYFGDDTELIDADTKTLLNKAIINPEVQIDFLDFLNSLSPEDKIMLLDSLGSDYKEDALANILIPVFLSQPDSKTGKHALELLGNSRSQLAYHALTTALHHADESIVPAIKRNISILKMAGIRQDNSHEFYKEILSASKPYRFCATYPDGHGNQALIFSRIRENGKIQFVAIVIDDYHGIRDCFGFNEISKFECDKIIERFYKDETPLDISPKALKLILTHAETMSKTSSNNWLIPYEYVCWNNLLADIETDNNDIKSILETEFNIVNLTIDEFEHISSLEFLNHWFLNADYSDEYEEFTEKINKALYENIDTDLDLLIEDDLYKIFYPNEVQVWTDRILMCAYLKLISGNKDDARMLYNLYNSQNYRTELFKNIVRKSIYEYYVALKFNIAENQGRFNAETLCKIIDNIERKWVK